MLTRRGHASEAQRDVALRMHDVSTASYVTAPTRTDKIATYMVHMRQKARKKIFVGLLLNS